MFTGPELASAIARSMWIGTLLLVALVAAVAIGGWELAKWLCQHIAITWH